MKKLIALIFAVLALTSCATTRSLSLGSSRYLSVEIFQTLSSTEALAMSKNVFSPHYGEIVKVVSDKEFYYDRAKIRGTFVMVGRYSYESRGNGFKTVPVYMRASEYRKYHR